MTAKLLTKIGEFVVDVETPPFTRPPDVIVWGERFFHFITTVSYIGDEDKPPDYWEYRECFAWFAYPSRG